MPLERVEVRNEYGLGSSELYKEANRQEDPKALLEGLAVSGLVGILRQLGDLAEFAAEVFHGLQEQVMTTSSRSHRLMVRVHNIEAALPSIEKAVLAQTSHIHFAYTAGSEWHPRIKKEQNHFIYNDLPRFIMDSYEECRDPPRLQMLDKFDTGGPGSCLKRYSDPTFFRRVSGNFKESVVDKVRKDKKARKRKKKRSSQRNGDLRAASMPNLGGRMDFTTASGNGRSSPTYTTSTFDMTLKSDMGDRSNSFGSRTESGYIDNVFHSNSTAPQNEHDSSQDFSRFMEHDDIHVPAYREEQHCTAIENIPQSLSPGQVSGGCVTWDEKEEITKPRFEHFDLNEGPEILAFNSEMDMPDDVNHDNRNSDMDMRGDVNSNLNSDVDVPDDVNPDQGNSEVDMLSDVNSDLKISDMDLPGDLVDSESTSKSSSVVDRLDEVESEPDNYLDALNTIESESESDLDFQPKRDVPQVPVVPNDEKREHKMHISESQNLGHHSDKNELNISSGISSKIEALANLVSSYSSEPEETFQRSGSSSISHSLPVTADTARTIILDDAKLEPSDSCPTSSGSTTEHANQPLQDKNLSPSYNSQESMVEFRGATSDSKREESVTGFSGGTSSSKIRELMLQSSLDASFSNSQESMAEPTVDASVSKTQVSLVPRMGGASVSKSLESMVECSMGASVSKTRESMLECSEDETFSNSQQSMEECSGEASVSKSEQTLIERSGDASVSNFPQPKVDLSGVTPVTIWTNGGLLGLEPSKPPDFAMSTAARQNLVMRSKVEASTPPNDKLVLGDVGREEKPTPASGIVEQDAKVEKSSSSQDSCSYGDDFYAGVLQSMTSTEKKIPRGADIKGSSSEARLANDESSSRVFGLVNGLRRTLSLGSDGKSELVSSLRTNVEEQSSGNSKFQATSGKAYNEKFGWNLAFGSPSSSPPLEHMKISFRPADGFDVAKLKLKFPDGSHSNGRVRDAFPSFQLIPENALALHEVVSDSDDDTFCRSSPYMSDDYLSHKSDVDSELWESEESESISPFQRTEETGTNVIHLEMGLKSELTENGADSSLSSAILDLPSFDSMSTVTKRSEIDNLKPKNVLESHQSKECSPLPPPLPPAQWRGSQIPLDDFEDQKPAINEVWTSEKLLPGRDLSQLLMNSEPAVAVQQPIPEKSHSFRFSKDELKVMQKEAFQPTNIKDSDDFLNQIRTKSFSLRRTVTAKPVLTSGPANDKVTAILKKANAIRQAVGSDDGEEDDDNWSE